MIKLMLEDSGENPAELITVPSSVLILPRYPNPLRPSQPHLDFINGEAAFNEITRPTAEFLYHGIYKNCKRNPGKRRKPRGIG